MSRQSEAVKKWRNNTKRKLMEAFDGKCGCCGYDACSKALEFHHLNPAEKETSWGILNANPKKWETIVEEIMKCVMVCSNCHKEIHAGYRAVPENIQRYDANLITVKEQPTGYPIRVKHARFGRYDGHDLRALLKELGSYRAVGDKFDVSGAAIKRYIDHH